MPALFVMQTSLAQQVPLAPSIEYTINRPFNSLILPSLNWIIEEGETTLLPSDLSANQLKDVTLLDLSSNPIFPAKIHTYYWFHVRINNKAQHQSLGLSLARTGECWPWEFTFKTVECFTRDSLGAIEIGYTGTAYPSSRRDFKQFLDPSLIALDLMSFQTEDMWVRVSLAEACPIQVDLQLI